VALRQEKAVANLARTPPAWLAGLIGKLESCCYRGVPERYLSPPTTSEVASQVIGGFTRLEGSLQFEVRRVPGAVPDPHLLRWRGAGRQGDENCELRV